MKRIRARHLLKYSTTELWDILIGKFILVFDDGEEAVVNYRTTLYSSYVWDFHRHYPNTPLLKKHHADYVLRGNDVTSKTHFELIAMVFWDVAATYNLHTPALRDPAIRKIFEVTNNLYVEMSERAERFVVSIDILDFLQIVDHPVAKPVLDNLSYENEKIVESYAVLLDLLNNSPDLNENAVARATRAKMVNANQVLQCVGPRGYMTHVDGTIIPTPVLRSYTKGMGNLFNVMAEAQSAAKSLYFSESPLQDAEYFSRRLQLLCMVVERLSHRDCGSTEYLIWRVKPPVESKGTVAYAGDLKFLTGKYYLDEATQQLKAIKSTDKHLYNTTIKLRSVLYCREPDPHAVCSVCFGQLSDNVTEEANLGHVCAATMTQQTTQSVMSTKHLDASSRSEPILLTEISKQYFSIGKNNATYVLLKELREQNLRIVVTQEEAFGLTDINLTSNVEDISPARISEIDFIGFQTLAGDIKPVCISQNGRYAMFTHDFLNYLKTQHWELDSKNNFVFDLTHWDFTKPVFQLPEIEYSFAQHSHQIAQVIESRMKDITDRQRPESPAKTLTELFDLVNAKLNVNLALLEVIIYASMVRDIDSDDFGLARGSDKRMLGVAEMTIKNRSLSAAYAFEEQVSVITNPASYYKLNRPDSVFDAFICPREVVEHYQKIHPR